MISYKNSFKIEHNFKNATTSGKGHIYGFSDQSVLQIISEK